MIILRILFISLFIITGIVNLLLFNPEFSEACRLRADVSADEWDEDLKVTRLASLGLLILSLLTWF